MFGTGEITLVTDLQLFVTARQERFSSVFSLNEVAPQFFKGVKMKSVLISCLVVLMSMLCAPVVQAQKVSARYDKSVDFSKFNTFAFDKSGARNPFVDKLIVDAVIRELTSRGLTKVDTDPDLRVVYLAAAGPNLQVADIPFYHVVNPAYSGMIFSATSAMWDVTTGTLVIDLFDHKTERTVFRGSASDVLQRSASADAVADAKMVSKPIKNSVSKMFKKYPVKPK